MSCPALVPFRRIFAAVLLFRLLCHLIDGCSLSCALRVSAAVSRREKRSGVQFPAVFRRPFSVHFVGIVSRHRLPEPPSIYHAWSIAYLALLERSILFHALIVFDGLGGDGGGDLAGVGYLGVGSR